MLRTKGKIRESKRDRLISLRKILNWLLFNRYFVTVCIKTKAEKSVTPKFGMFVNCDAERPD